MDLSEKEIYKYLKRCIVCRKEFGSDFYSKEFDVCYSCKKKHKEEDLITRKALVKYGKSYKRIPT